MVYDKNASVYNWKDIFNAYSESFSINTQYLVRNEMSKTNNLYQSSKANIYYIENGYYKYKDDEYGIVEYGAYPNTVNSSVHMSLKYTHRLDLFYKN